MPKNQLNRSNSQNITDTYLILFLTYRKLINNSFDMHYNTVDLIV